MRYRESDPDLMQVSRTDANVLFELDPQDLEVIQQMNYSSVIPEVKVGSSMSCFIPINSLQAATSACSSSSSNQSVTMSALKLARISIQSGMLDGMCHGLPCSHLA